MSIEYCEVCKFPHPNAHECQHQITTGGIVKPTPTRYGVALVKLMQMMEGKTVIMSDAELNLICEAEASNYIRSRPNPKQCGILDSYECWIEPADAKKIHEFNAAQFDADLAESDE